MVRIVRILVILTLVVGGYLFGQLEWLERELMDLRARTHANPASSQLVVVAIDEPSLREFSVWPWPRRLYAAALARLTEAGARQVAFDIDFSSYSNPEDDGILAAELAKSTADIVLPNFRQPIGDSDGKRMFLESAPIPMFRIHGTLAAFNVRPDTDGKVRRMFTREHWNETIVPYYAALIAGAHGRKQTGYYIDFSISPAAIPHLSFADVVKGRFDPAVVRGRSVIIGATALQLGDMVPVPIYRALPGATVQALAYSSLATGRAIERLDPPWLIALIVLMLTITRLSLKGRDWRFSLPVSLIIMGGAAYAVTAVQIRMPLYIDLAPLLLITALDFLSRMATRLRRQDMKLFVQSLALRRREMFMRLVVENSFDAIVTLRPDGIVMTYNHAAENVFGQAREDVVGAHISRLMPDLNISGGGKLDDLLAMRGIYEITCEGQSGNLLILDISVAQISTDKEMFIVLLARDITEKRNAEAQARRAEEYLIESIESVDAGLAVFDRNDRLMVANRRYLDKTGLGGALHQNPTYAETARTISISGYFVQARQKPEDWVADRMHRHRAKSASIIEQTADGHWILTSERRTPDNGTIVVETDITSLKQREAALIEARDQAEAANRTKSEFLAAMSHELRTPLNAIIGFSEMMDRQIFGPLGAENYVAYAKDIHSSGKHLLAIINDILDMAKIEAGQFKINEQAMSLGEAVTGTVRLLQESAAAKRLELVVENPERGLGLMADPRIVRQVLLNLLSNAIKFTPEGGRVELRGERLAGGCYGLTISDNGIGMSAEDLEKALQPFGQVQSSLARSYEGTGLGLPLVKRFMEMHGGRLDIRSVPGQGTQATVVFPPERVLESRRSRQAIAAV